MTANRWESLDPRTPVVAGVGVATQAVDEPGGGLEALELMIAATQAAGDDSGAAGLLAAALLANGEGVLRLADRRERWRKRWNDKKAEEEAWGPSGRVPILVLGGIALADFVAAEQLIPVPFQIVYVFARVQLCDFCDSHP